MITQEHILGTHKIKIESAESLSDAEKNSFKQGEYTRCYVNGKRTDNYMAMVRFIVDESKKNNTQLVPSGQNVIELRKKLFENQGKMLADQITKIKEQYKTMDLPQNVLIQIDEYLNKIDLVTNVRVLK
jgi:hypothetical protein